MDRYIDMRSSVMDVIKKYEVTRLGVEYPIFNDIYSEGMYGLFLYTCEALRLSKVDVVFFSPGQVKAHARNLEILLPDPKTGIPTLQPIRPRGWKMAKPDMVEAAKMDTGGKGSWNHNEADAYWVARTAGRFWAYYDSLVSGFDSDNPDTIELSPLEKKQFTDIHTFTKGRNAGKTVEKGILYRENERFFLWTQES